MSKPNLALDEQKKSNYLVLAFYKFCELPEPLKEVQLQKKLIESLDASCRIYISEEGINGQMSVHKDQAQIFMDDLHSRPYFSDLKFKFSPYHENCFPKKQ